MENYIMYQGRKLELTEEQVKALKLDKTPFERVKRGETYLMINPQGCVIETEEQEIGIDNVRFERANYCNDHKLMVQRSYHEILSRMLWRFTYENGWSEKLWEDSEITKWKIYKNSEGEIFRTWWSSKYKELGEIYFVSAEIAQRAIDEIIIPFMEKHPEFKW